MAISFYHSSPTEQAPAAPGLLPHRGSSTATKIPGRCPGQEGSPGARSI